MVWSVGITLADLIWSRKSTTVLTSSVSDWVKFGTVKVDFNSFKKSTEAEVVERGVPKICFKISSRNKIR